MNQALTMNNLAESCQKRGGVLFCTRNDQAPRSSSAIAWRLWSASPAPKLRRAWHLFDVHLFGVRDLLAELGETSAEDVSGRFNGAQVAQAEKLLESLAAVRVAIEMRVGGRRWGLVR